MNYINKKVKITTYAPGLLGNFNEVTITGMDSYEGILEKGVDIVAIHANVISSIPENLRISIKDDTYFTVIDSTGQRKTIGESWIVPDGIFTITDTTMRIIVKGGNINAVKSALAYAGIYIESYEIISN